MRYATEWVLRLASLAFLSGAGSAPLSAYSVLTHEAIVDTLWESPIKPLLLKRFAAATPEDLVRAHAYTYGGSISQDMGYYPFGSHQFTDLVHYVRSGDFVVALIDEAQNLNEYAFALGALTHYAADNLGHSEAVNRAVPILYPKLRRMYGDVVTYEDEPGAHMKVEFGLDVAQVARGRYAPQAYHDFIGFKVSKEVLDRAFEKTYGLKLKDVFTTLDLSIGTYRHTVSKLIPEMTRAAWAAKKKELIKNQPGVTRKKFLYDLSRASYRKEWGEQYQEPGLLARFFAAIFRLIPKVGPFKALAFKPPTPQTELLFEKSFEEIVQRNRQNYAAVNAGTLRLPNQDFDTGRPTRPGEYKLADEAYVRLVDKLASKKFLGLPPDLKANIMKFFSEGPVKLPDLTPEEQQKLRTELEAMKAFGS